MGLLVVAGMMVIGRYLLPRLFAQAARTKSPELFLVASLLVVIARSLATAAVGLSPIVGALIAGLLIAETEYHGEVEVITAPFKGLALGVFLITVGHGRRSADDPRQPGPTRARCGRRDAGQDGGHRRCCCGWAAAAGGRGRDRPADGLARPKPP